jgi:hypothetical protein
VDASVHFTVGAQTFIFRDVKNVCLGRDNFKFIYVKEDGENDDNDDDNNNNNNNNNKWLVHRGIS